MQTANLHTSEEPAESAFRELSALVGLLTLVTALALVWTPQGLIGRSTFLYLHLLPEGLSAALAAMIFACAWDNSAAAPKRDVVDVWFCVFLGVAVLDFSHLFNYAVAPESAGEPSRTQSLVTYFGSHLLSTLCLFGLALANPRTIAPRWLPGTALAATAAYVALILWLPSAFPSVVDQLFRANGKPGTLAPLLQYGLVALALVPVLLFYKKLDSSEAVLADYLWAASAVFMLSLIYFAGSSEQVRSDAPLGRINHLIAYWLLYRAALKTYVTRPVRGLRSAVQTLQDMEARLAALTASVADPIVLIAANGRIVLFNLAAETVLRCKAADALDTSIARFISPAQSETFLDRIGTLASQGNRNDGSSEHFELAGLRQDGEEFPLEVDVTLLWIRGQAHIAAVLHDVTLRQQTETKLSERTAALAEKDELLKLAPVLAWSFDDEHIVFWNGGAQHVYGFSGKETMGRNPHQLLCTQFPEPLEALKHKLLEDGKWSGELLQYAKDGSELVVATEWMLHSTDGGHKIVIEAISDITQLKQIKAELRQSEQNHRLLVEASPIGIFVVQDEKLVYCNPAFAQLLGVSRPTDLLGVGPLTLIHPDYHDLVRARMAMLLTHKTSIPHAEERFLCADGTQVEVDVCATPFVFNGKPAVQVMVRDLSESRKAARALAQAHEELKQHARRLKELSRQLAMTEERERRAISADLHDEIGQLLAVAKIKLAGVAGIEDAAHWHAACAEIESLLDRMNLGVRRLALQLSPPVLHRLGLAAALEWLAEELDKDFELSVAVKDDGNAKPFGLELGTILFRVIRELLINVAKHARVKSAEVILHSDGSRLIVVVRDEGVGFDPDIVAHPDEPGHFGLFNASERIASFGGTLQIDSGRGSGTVVTITLPLGSPPSETGHAA